MVDRICGEARLAGIYDSLEAGRADLGAYCGMVEEFPAASVLDVGCGTGVFAGLLVERGVEVVGVDPAEASLVVARGKEFAGRVRWVHGDATSLPPLEAGRVETWTELTAVEVPLVSIRATFEFEDGGP
ncbi:class I SAM-dependent methyltransferase [Kribbella sp. DT2]|uniref:class I SAM-dependent methyltransferase n=1 Tax=Kribbella sp. DT2 TaxID=3393427 RepID=UPI003CF49DC0